MPILIAKIEDTTNGNEQVGELHYENERAKHEHHRSEHHSGHFLHNLEEHVNALVLRRGGAIPWSLMMRSIPLGTLTLAHFEFTISLSSSSDPFSNWKTWPHSATTYARLAAESLVAASDGCGRGGPVLGGSGGKVMAGRPAGAVAPAGGTTPAPAA